MKKLNRSSKKKMRSSLRVETLEQRQLLAGITGGGTEVGSNIVHSNGNVYDQVLMTGSAVSVTADAGQITRVSFLDLSGDIVQVEFSGAGSLNVSLDSDSFQGAAEATNYNQPGVKYVTGLASFTITGSDASTNFSVFTVGSATAYRGVDNPIFDGGKLGGNNLADVQRLTIVADPSNANGSAFGGIRMGNAVFGNASGVVGIAATNVAVQDVVVIGDINATDSATPSLSFGANSQFGVVTVAGGDLVNSKTIGNSGYKYDVVLNAGTTSGGTTLAASTNYDGLSFTQTPASVAAAAPATPKSMDLTANVDTTLVGGAANDTYNASQTTLNSGDQLSGGAGTDTLQITTTALANLGAGVTSNSVEAISVTATVGAATVDATSFSGVTTVTSTGSTAAVTVNNLSAIPTVNVTGTDQNMTVNMAAAAVVDTADSATLNLNGAGTQPGHTQAITIAGVESLTINATGTASGAVDAITGAVTPVTVRGGAAVTSVTITGTAANRLDLSLNGTSSTVTGTLTGSDAVNDITLAAAGKVSGSLAGGDDTLRLAAVSANLSISGGDGTDSLIYTGAADVTAATATAGLTSFESVTITGGASFAMAASNVTYTTAPVSKTFTSLSSGGSINLEAGGTLTLANTSLSGTSDSATINVGKSGANGTGATGATITAGDYETVTINSLVATGTATTATAAYTVNGATRVTLIAPHAATLAGTGTALTTIDASNVQGGFSSSATTSSTVALSITGGAGADVLAGGSLGDSLVGGLGADSLTGNAGNDILDGGDGADTLTGGDGADTLTGGAGVDRFVFSANNTGANPAVNISTLSAPDVITDFVSGTDKLAGTGAVAFLGNFQNIQGALAANNASGVLANSAAFVVGENNLYVFSAAGLSLNVNDVVIKLSGVSSIAAGDLLLGAQGSGSTVSLSAATSNVGISGTVTGASGNTSDLNDTVTAATVTYVVATANVNAGLGTDTLSLTIKSDDANGMVTAAELANFSNFEALTLNSRTQSAGSNVYWNVTIPDTLVGANSTFAITLNHDGKDNAGVVQAAGSGNIVSAAGVTTAGKSVSITGGSGSDQITGSNGSDTIVGGAGNDAITPGIGNDSVSGGDGNDTFTLGVNLTSADTISGGAGSAGNADTLTFTNPASAAATALDNVTGVETITYTPVASGVSVAADRALNALTISAGSAFATDTAVRVITQHDNFASTVNFTNVTAGSINYTGGTTADVITGSNTLGDTLTGGGGNDTISGGGGNDRIDISAVGDYSVSGGAGNDTIIAGATLTVDDTVSGGEDNDTLTFGAVFADTALDKVTGIENLNQTIGAVTAVTITASSPFAADTAARIYTVSGDFAATLDFAAVTAGTLDVRGAGGDDEITGSATLADTLSGGAGADTIVGGGGADYIMGGEGDDEITPGTGNDIVNLTETTSAADTVLFAEGGAANVDRITGFTVGTDFLATSDGVLTLPGLQLTNNIGTWSGTSGVDVDTTVPTVQVFVNAAANSGTVEASAVNGVVKLTTGAASFGAALGTTSITLHATVGAGEVIMVTWFDSVNNQMVMGFVNSVTDGTIGNITQNDLFVEVARVDMSAADYAALTVASIPGF